MNWRAIDTALRGLEASGRRVRLWWRDDDAVAATARLERLIGLSVRFQAPVLLAVIPRDADRSLADRLVAERRIVPAVHGFGHANHAGPDERKQELGPHRPLGRVLADLASGRQALSALFGDNLADVLVPPWNRIAGDAISRLPHLGFRGLSCFGPEEKIPPVPGLRVHNAHIDPVDWRGSRGLREPGMLAGAVARALGPGPQAPPDRPVGLLTHHLLHDESVWRFVEGFLERTVRSPACEWSDPRHLFGC